MLGLKANDLDNVATIFAVIKKGEVIKITDAKGHIQEINSIDDIPYGHKIALKDIKIGESITKYGNEIGLATHEIKLGDYVHVHNLESNRARGDK